MSLKAMNWAWTIGLPPAPKLVLMALADEADDRGFCFPSVKHLAHKCNIAERTVQRIVRVLLRLGYLSVEQRFRKDRAQSSNGYRLAVDPPSNCHRAPDPDVTPRVTPVTGGGRHSGHRAGDTGDGVTTTYPCIDPPPPPTRALQVDDHERDGGGGDLCFPKTLSKNEERQLRSHLARLSHDGAQQVLDELAGRMNATAVRNPIRYCLSLIDRLERGSFTPELGLQVAQRREAHRRHAAVLRAPPTVPVSARQVAIPLPDAMRETLERMRPMCAAAKETPAQSGDGSRDLPGQETRE